MPRRIACLLVPDFPLAARFRQEPQITQAAIAVFEAEGATPAVIAASPTARRRGIHPGLSLHQARALFPEIVARPRDRAAEQSAQERLLETASGLSPIIENSGLGCIYLDLRGMGDERALAERAVDAAAAAGFSAQVGVAEGRTAARLAAWRSRGNPAILPKGGDAAYLAPLSLAWLKPPPPLLERLARWGIRTAGEFAALSPGDVARRLGPEGLALHRTAQGSDERPLSAWRSPLVFSERIDLEWTLCGIEAFCAVTRPMLDRLGQHLSTFGVACRRLDLELSFDPKGEETRSLSLAAPTAEVKTLLELLSLELAAHPPRAPVNGITLHAHPEPLRQAQFSLFGPASPSPDSLATVRARLSLLLGADRIGSPQRADGTRPERYFMSEYAPPPPRRMPLLERPSLAAAIRVLRPKILLKVQYGGVPPQPIQIKTEKRADPLPSISGKVRVASGPWRLEEGWWSEEAVTRDYWDLELADGGVYRIFHDRQQGNWFADGVYD
ncbi:MAG: DNA polymerase Y family protein [Nitrospirae bacterium]|nr:DNA polymerase Y family protein [Candidatus Manganitrophaceae bacterium]